MLVVFKQKGSLLEQRSFVTAGRGMRGKSVDISLVYIVQEAKGWES